MVFAEPSDTVGFIPFCQGLLVKRIIITARHCLVPRHSPTERIFTINGPDTGKRLKDPADMNDTVYYFNKDHWQAITARHSTDLVPSVYRVDPMVEVDDDHHGNHDLDDWIVLNVVQDNRLASSSENLDALRIEDIKSHRLLLVGLNIAAIWSFITSEKWRGSFHLNDLLDMTRVEYSAFCRVVYNHERIFSHMCQTDQGVSGLPIFVQSNFPNGTSFKFVGIQSGAAYSSSTSNGTCVSKMEEQAPNHGISLPPAIVAKIFGPSRAARRY